MDRTVQDILADMEIKDTCGHFIHFRVGLPKNEILTLLIFATQPGNECHDEIIKERLRWCISSASFPTSTRRRDFENDIAMVLENFFDNICKYNRTFLLQESSVILFYGLCSFRTTDTGNVGDRFSTEENWQLEGYKSS